MEQAIASEPTATPVFAAATVDELAAVFAGARQQAYWVALHLVGDTAEAEDLLQEALLRAQRSLGKFRGESSLKTWLLRILVNLCLKSQRRRALWHRVRDLLPGVPPAAPATPEHLSCIAQEGRRLTQALERLSPQQRAAFLLRHAHDLPLADVAAVLEVSVETAKTHLARAIQRLRLEMRENLHE